MPPATDREAGEEGTMKVIIDWVCVAMIGASLALTGAAVTDSPAVLLAVPMAGYGLPACETPDTALVGGCRWVGPGEQGTWVNYATGRK